VSLTFSNSWRKVLLQFVCVHSKSFFFSVYVAVTVRCLCSAVIFFYSFFKLLIEAEKRGFIDEDSSSPMSRDTFNPINLLAQYLMRNNPRYCQLQETSPYVRGLRRVAEDLKRDVYEMEINK